MNFKSVMAFSMFLLLQHLAYDPLSTLVKFFCFFEAKEAVKVIETSDVIMPVEEVIEGTEVFRTTQVLEINKNRITFFDVLKKNNSV